MKQSHSTQTAVHIGTGMAPLLMLFCILCLITFAVLSYVQARAQLSMSDKAVTHIEEHYQQRAQVRREG